jgi:phosphatidylglycerophosphatase C
MQQALALFDFDGTITKKDSFIEFIKYYKGFRSFCFGFIILSPILLLYMCGIIKNSRTKSIVFSWFFKNEAYKVFKSKCRSFSLTIIPNLIRSNALAAIKQHIQSGYKVIIISASFEDYLTDWCRSMELELIGTKIEIKNDSVTGKLDGKNCYGAEKVIRLKQLIDLSQFSEIYAYSDSRSDMPLLKIANQRFYKYF